MTFPSQELANRTQDIINRLTAEFSALAVCHCGSYMKDHSQLDNHSPVWMKCQYTELLDDTIELLKYINFSFLIMMALPPNPDCIITDNKSEENKQSDDLFLTG